MGDRVSPILHLTRYSRVRQFLPRECLRGPHRNQESRNGFRPSFRRFAGPWRAARSPLFLPALDSLAGARRKPSRRKLPPKYLISSGVVLLLAVIYVGWVFYRQKKYHARRNKIFCKSCVCFGGLIAQHRRLVWIPIWSSLRLKTTPANS